MSTSSINTVVKPASLKHQCDNILKLPRGFVNIKSNIRSNWSNLSNITSEKKINWKAQNVY